MFYIGRGNVARKFVVRLALLVIVFVAIVIAFIGRLDVKDTLAPAAHEPPAAPDTAGDSNRLAIAAGAVEPNRLPDGKFALADKAEIRFIDVADVHDGLPQ
jgi:hypothetical protein